MAIREPIFIHDTETNTCFRVDFAMRFSKIVAIKLDVRKKVSLSQGSVNPEHQTCVQEKKDNMKYQYITKQRLLK